MKKFLLVGVAGVAFVCSALVHETYADTDDSQGHHGYRQELRAALLDARLAGIKACLNLTADEERNWAALESAARAIAKNRAERHHEMRKCLSGKILNGMSHL